MFNYIYKLYKIFKRKRKKSTCKNSKESVMLDKNLVSPTQDSYDVIIKVGKKLTVEVEELIKISPYTNSNNNNNPFRNKEFLSKLHNQNYKEFYVHSSILLKDIKSRYFYNALSNINNNDLKKTEKNMIKENNFEENKIIVLELPEINPKIFEVILE
jgi:hypothetical protein